MAPTRRAAAPRRLEWPADGSPARCAPGADGACEVVRPTTAPVAGAIGCVKDPAGYYFHLYALKQAGLWGE